MVASILIVEDNPANLELMTYILAAHGYRLLTATDGERDDLLFGRVFMERTMPETALRLARIEAGADRLMAIPDGAF